MTYLSLAGWLSGRRPAFADRAMPLTASSGTLATPIAFGIASVIEIVAVHFLIPWPWLRWSLLASSLWALVAFASLLAHHRLNPHTLTPTTLTLRSFGHVVAEIPLVAVSGARIHRRYGAVTSAIENGRLLLPTQDGSSVDIDLASAVDAALPSFFARGRKVGPVTACSLQVDDPAGVVRAIREQVGLT